MKKNLIFIFLIANLLFSCATPRISKSEIFTDITKFNKYSSNKQFDKTFEYLPSKVWSIYNKEEVLKSLNTKKKNLSAPFYYKNLKIEYLSPLKKVDEMYYRVVLYTVDYIIGVTPTTNTTEKRKKQWFVIYDKKIKDWKYYWGRADILEKMYGNEFVADVIKTLQHIEQQRENVRIKSTSQKLIPQITTNKNDPKIKNLTGTWYSSLEPNELWPLKFSKTPQDTATITYSFKKNGIFKSNSTKIDRELLWILTDNKLYIEASISEKGKCVVYEVKKLTNKEMILDFAGYKNIYEPFLCGESPHLLTMRPAKFDTYFNSFQSYFEKNMKFEIPEKPNQIDFTVEFDINCKGEICNIEPREWKKTPFGNKIISLLKQMPKWIPAKHRGKPVDVQKIYVFRLIKGQLQIIESR